MTNPIAVARQPRTAKTVLQVVMLSLLLLMVHTTVQARGTCVCREGTTARFTGCLPSSGDCTTSCDTQSPEGATWTPNWTEGENSPACTTSGGGGSSSTRKLENPLTANSIQEVVGRAVRIFTGISGSVALLMFVYGGFLMLTSGGNEERVSKGKKALTWATLGLLFIFMSYAILAALFRALNLGL